MQTDDPYDGPNEEEHLPAVVKTTDSAQAKTDAISALTMKVYDRASMLQLTPDESAKLQADFPDEAFKPGAGGKKNLIYIEHAYLRDRLNEVLGLGQWTIIQRNRWGVGFSYTNDDGSLVEGTTVYVEAMLCVRGCLVDEAIGDMAYYPKNLSTNYGDAVEGAKTQALRRCAKTLGVGLQAWKKDWCIGWWKRKGTQTPDASENGSESAPTYGERPPCPKCGSKDAVIVGKPEYGGGFVCFKKKKGCGHKWDGKDVRTGEDAAPAKPHADTNALIDEWEKKLNPQEVNLKKLNAEIIPEFKAIPGQTKGRPRIWTMIVNFAESFNCYFNHGSKLFEEKV